MRIELISTYELREAEELAWRRLQAQDRTIALPALSPEWARCVGLARPDARVAVIEDERGRTRGYLPVQAGPSSVLEPLAASLDLGCGVVGEAQLEWDAGGWLKRIGATAFPFSGAPEQVELARSARGDMVRFSAELRAGAWRDIDAQERRTRRMDAMTVATGRLPRIRRFSCERADFDCTVHWSAAAFGLPRENWEVAALRAAFECDEEDSFFGALFTMGAGPELAAGAFFLVDRQQAQLAFYGENPIFAAHEPAAVVVEDGLRALALRGVAEVDFGANEGRFVHELATRRRRRLYGQIRPNARRLIPAPLARLVRPQCALPRRSRHAC
jgi:CelD/BcsL family acetyltransferase involved in cellulose biosynthesis